MFIDSSLKNNYVLSIDSLAMQGMEDGFPDEPDIPTLAGPVIRDLKPTSKLTSRIPRQRYMS
jgi:hypothetical protein